MSPMRHDAPWDAAFERELVVIVGAPGVAIAPARRLLAAHPRLAAIGDGRFAERLAAPLKDALASCNADPGADVPAFTQGDFRHLSRVAIGLALAKLDLEGVLVVAMEATAHAHALDFLDNLFPTCKVLHLIADGRPAAMANTGAGGLEAAAYAWTDGTRTARAFGATRPERYYELRLEDLAADPGGQLPWLWRFLELDANELAAHQIPPAAPAFTGTPDQEALILKRQAALLRQLGYIA